MNTANPDAEELANLLRDEYQYQVELITDDTDRKPTLKERLSWVYGVYGIKHNCSRFCNALGLRICGLVITSKSGEPKELENLLTKWLPEQLQPPAENNRLLFYFAGHGMPLESDHGSPGKFKKLSDRLT